MLCSRESLDRASELPAVEVAPSSLAAVVVQRSSSCFEVEVAVHSSSSCFEVEAAVHSSSPSCFALKLELRWWKRSRSRRCR